MFVTELLVRGCTIREVFKRKSMSKFTFPTPTGKRLYSMTKKLKPWAGEQEIARFKIDAPQLWSPAKPSLYSCLVTCDWQRVRERFGIRNVEWGRPRAV